MLEMVASPHVAITCSAISASQDPDLERIQRYLEERLAQSQEICASATGQRAVIDIAQLGQRNVASDAGERIWDADLVYPLKIRQSVVLFGPLYHPGAKGGPCPLCLERNWQALRIQEEQEALYDLQQTLVFGANPRLTPFALDQIWQVIELAVCHPLSFASPIVQGRSIYALNLDSFQVERQLLLPDALCPACAAPQPDTPEAATIQLTSQQKPALNTYHRVKATDYDLPLAGYINPICGLLGGDVYHDHFHLLTSPVSGHFWVKGRYALNKGWWGGHGTSYRSSYALAMLEALERYSGFRPRAKSVDVFESYEHLAPDALDPRTCGLYRPEVYTAAAPLLTPFHPERPIHWVWGYSFRQGRPLLVPEQLVYYHDYRDAAHDDHFVVDNSNGCATGSTLEEAILFGLLELIERDTFLLSWYARLAPPRIDPWSSQNQQTLYLLNRIDRLGYDLHLLDTRMDLPFPTIVGVAVRRTDSLGKLILAAGVSLDPEDAIRATLCEVGAYISGFEDRLEKHMDQLRPMLQDYARVTNIEQHPLLYGLPEMAPHASFLLQNPIMRSVAETYAQWHQEMPRSLDQRDDLEYCLKHVLALGLDVIVVDQTCPQEERDGLKTVSVIVPGLMPISFGYYRERVLELPRLRTVPRTAGFLEKDFDPAFINITPHPFP